jgi:hypothetical protein
MRYDLIVFGVSVIVIFLGLAIIRVGFVGRYLGQLKMVSYVKKYSYEPRSYHRWITIGIGIVFVLLGTSAFIVVMLSLSKQR